MEGNLEVFEREGFILVSVNPKFYPLEVVFSAAYAFIDRCYVLVDGDLSDEVIVELRPKSAADLKVLGREFNNELVNYAAYSASLARTAAIREAILKRVLLTNTENSGDAKDLPK